MSSDTLTTAKDAIEQTVREGYDFAGMMQDFIEKRGFNLLMGLLVLAIGILMARKVKNFVRIMMLRSKMDSSAVGFLSQILYFALLIAIGISALGTMGFPTNSFVAAVGGLGIAVGLALQGNLSNLASGILILIFKPFRVGEFIEGSGVSGTVEEIQIMSTILYTVDYKRVIIPNSKLTSENVINYSFSDDRRITFHFDIDYHSDHNKAMQIIRDIFIQDQEVMDEPQPLVAIKEFVDHSLRIVAIPWVKNEHYWDVYYRVMQEVKEGFDEAGIQRPISKAIYITETSRKQEDESGSSTKADGEKRGSR